MGYTMAADSEELTTLSSELSKKSEKIGGSIESIFTVATEEDSDTWKGSGFDSFKEGIGEYKPAMELVPKVMTDFGTAFTEIAGKAEELVTAVDDAINGIQ